MMQAPEIWGDDAAVFRPERWLEMRDEERREREAVVELAFGSGRYRCLGRRLAGVELAKVVGEVGPVSSLASFRFHFLPVLVCMWVLYTVASR
jgi:hypothetical protein